MVNVGTVASAMVTTFASVMCELTKALRGSLPTFFYTRQWDSTCRYRIVSVRLRGPRSGYIVGSALAEGQELVSFNRRQAKSTPVS